MGGLLGALPTPMKDRLFDYLLVLSQRMLITCKYQTLGRLALRITKSINRSLGVICMSDSTQAIAPFVLIV